MNRIFIVGNLTKDPECSMSASGIAVCHFTVADNYVVSNEKKANFHRITAFRQQAENCSKYLSKGRKIAVVGKIQQGVYTNNEGHIVNTQDVFADEITFLDYVSDGASQPTATKPTTTAPKAKQTSMLEVVNNDSLPF